MLYKIQHNTIRPYTCTLARSNLIKKPLKKICNAKGLNIISIYTVGQHFSGNSFAERQTALLRFPIKFPLDIKEKLELSWLPLNITCIVACQSIIMHITIDTTKLLFLHENQ